MDTNAGRLLTLYRNQAMWSHEDMKEQFNATYPVNSPIWYRRDNGSQYATFTRSEAWLLGDGTPVVKVEGIRGGVDVERITVRHLAA